MAKTKYCETGEHEVPVLWKAKGKSQKSACKRCWQRSQANVSKSNKKLVRKSIKPISDKRAVQLNEYRKLRDQYMKDHPQCEAKIETVCTGLSQDLHHKKPRAYHLCDVSIFSAVCRKCHEWIGNNSEESFKRGFTIKHL